MVLFLRSPNTEGRLRERRGRAGSLQDFLPSTPSPDMMAAEVSSEDTGSVTAGTGVAGGGGGGGPDTAPFPYYPRPSRVRVSDLAQGPAPALRQLSNTSPDSLPDMSLIYPLPGGDVTGSALSTTGSGGAGGGHSVFQGTTSGTGTGGGMYSPTSEGPASRFSPTPTGSDGPSVFPPLPPPPPPPPGYGAVGGGGGGGTMDESDMQDGPEYEEEEVVFPLSAPPSNQ